MTSSTCENSDKNQSEEEFQTTCITSDCDQNTSESVKKIGLNL